MFVSQLHILICEVFMYFALFLIELSSFFLIDFLYCSMCVYFSKGV